MVGQTISNYEILEELGRGGMGTVYKARDIVLDRILAVKVLRPDVINPVREKRFIQEAKTASSLNHPNIVHIYQIFHVGDSPCIAMEFVAGQTLEQLLEKGPLELRVGLNYAIQISDALTKAHAAGIIHRDLKPANVMITADGLVKILDFGLAKLLEVSEDSEAGDRLTQEGRIVGTPPYLSPEQAKASKADARSDIFSLGTVLFEAFTGVRPFERATNFDMLSAVVHDQPKKLRSVVKALPASLEKVVAQCLEKKPERRFQTMEEVRDALEGIRHSETLTRLLASQVRKPVWKSWRLWSAVSALSLMVLFAAVVLWRQATRAAGRLAPVITRITSDTGFTSDPAASPDGRFIAYSSDRGGDSLDVWIQPAKEGGAVRLTKHPADDREPTFSPDSSKIAFRSERDGGGIYVVSILGGEEHLMAQKGRRPRFSPDGKWIAYWTGFSSGDPTAPGSNKIFVVSADGGQVRQLVPHFESALFPVWSPDSKSVLFLGAGPPEKQPAPGELTGANRPVNRMDWWVARLDDSAPIRTGVHEALTKQGLSVWASSGAGITPELWIEKENRIIFSASFASPNIFHDSLNIWSVPLSKAFKPGGAARQITSGTAVESRAAINPSGDILFSSFETKTGLWTLPLKANEGKVAGELKAITHDAAFHGHPAGSLDGSRVVCYATSSGNMDIWTVDLHTGKETQLTSTPTGEFAPLISADGSTVYYSIYGKREAYAISTHGGQPMKLCDDCGTWDISHSGDHLLYWYSVAQPVVSIGMLEVPTGQKLKLISHPEYSLYQPHFSPDDKWIAFLAKIGQDRTRIYVAPFEGQKVGRWVAVTDGENVDDKPRWSPDGKLLYFVSERDGFRCIWAQPLDSQTKRPMGEPFNVTHFHTSRRSLMNVGLGPLEISVTRNALIFNLGEVSGNIWRASQL